MSSVPRGIAMIPLFANGKINGSPSFHFYQPGEFTTMVMNKMNNQLISFTTNRDFLKQGDVDISVNTRAKAPFSVLLRKPYWADKFTVSINGASYPVPVGEFIPIKRLWKKGDKISIHFQLPVIALDGNKSYPGMIALQRGPQILTYDQTINKTEVSDVKVALENIHLEDASSLLPANWIGKQGYEIDNNANGKKEKIMLVPYADAGQTGGLMSTWIKKVK